MMLGRVYRTLIPESFRQAVRRQLFIRNIVKDLRKIRNLQYAKQVLSVLEGRFPRHCPICGFEGYFMAKSIPMKTDAHCPSCKSVGKHRQLWQLIAQRESISAESRLLHFAPEDCLSTRLKTMVAEYTTADFMRNDVDLKLDIENIDLPSGSIDVVICNHVLEHVQHHKALSELHRIMAKGGRAFLTIPIVWEWENTYEDESVLDEGGRELHFGQFDHRRIFGQDFVTAVRAAGFEVREHTALGAECVAYGLLPGEKIFVAHKP